MDRRTIDALIADLQYARQLDIEAAERHYASADAIDRMIAAYGNVPITPASHPVVQAEDKITPAPQPTRPQAQIDYERAQAVKPSSGRGSWMKDPARREQLQRMQRKAVKARKAKARAQAKVSGRKAATRKRS